MQDVDYHRLSTADNLLAVLQIGKLYRRVLLLQLRVVLLLPFILR
jgi:hypothetical protein